MRSRHGQARLIVPWRLSVRGNVSGGVMHGRGRRTLDRIFFSEYAGGVRLEPKTPRGAPPCHGAPARSWASTRKRRGVHPQGGQPRHAFSVVGLSAIPHSIRLDNTFTGRKPVIEKPAVFNPCRGQQLRHFIRRRRIGGLSPRRLPRFPLSVLQVARAGTDMVVGGPRPAPACCAGRGRSTIVPASPAGSPGQRVGVIGRGKVKCPASPQSQ